MTTFTPTLTAHRMPGVARTEDGFELPQSTRFELDSPWHTPFGVDVRYLAVTQTAVLPCYGTGKLMAFRGRHLGERHTGITPVEELHRLGIEVTE